MLCRVLRPLRSSPTLILRQPPSRSRGRALLMDARRLVARTLDVFYVSSGVGMRLRVGAALAAELEDTVAQAPEELAIVRHEHHRPLEVLERVDQHLLGREI